MTPKPSWGHCGVQNLVWCPVGLKRCYITIWTTFWVEQDYCCVFRPEWNFGSRQPASSSDHKVRKHLHQVSHKMTKTLDEKDFRDKSTANTATKRSHSEWQLAACVDCLYSVHTTWVNLMIWSLWSSVNCFLLIWKLNIKVPLTIWCPFP